jgi:prephenate dehydrogenase
VYTRDPEDRRLAEAAGVRVGPLAVIVKDADLILLAVPIDRLAEVAREVVAAAPAHTTILHAGSLQRPDATRLDGETARRVIGTHPLAGSTRSGFSAATSDLFSGATVFVEARGALDQRTREDAELFWSMAGAGRIEYRDAAEHDDLMAAISHVPQILATSLAATLGYAGIHRDALGPGGRDMTRLAASSWEMWRPLLLASPGRTLAMLESIETELREFRSEIERRMLDETGVTWSVARAWALEERKPS